MKTPRICYLFQQAIASSCLATIRGLSDAYLPAVNDRIAVPRLKVLVAEHLDIPVGLFVYHNSRARPIYRPFATNNLAGVLRYE